MAGRPPTYHSTDERPVTVSVRVPKALYAQAQHYAKQRRMTLTELFLDGLQMRLETPTDPRELLMSDNSNTVLQQLREELKGALLAELRQDVAELLASAAGDELGTGARAGLSTAPREISSDNGNTVLQKSSPQPAFDATRYRLGKLCPQGHDYQGSGRSLLRRKKGDCVECGKLAKRLGRQRAKAAQQ